MARPSTSCVSACPPSRSSASNRVTWARRHRRTAAEDVRRGQPGDAGADHCHPAPGIPGRSVRRVLTWWPRRSRRRRSGSGRDVGAACGLDGDADAGRVGGITLEDEGVVGALRHQAGRSEVSRLVLEPELVDLAGRGGRHAVATRTARPSDLDRTTLVSAPATSRETFSASAPRGPGRRRSPAAARCRRRRPRAARRRRLPRIRRTAAATAVRGNQRRRDALRDAPGAGSRGRSWSGTIGGSGRTVSMPARTRSRSSGGGATAVVSASIAAASRRPATSTRQSAQVRRCASKRARSRSSRASTA